MKHLGRFAAIPFGFVVIAFAIANRGPVEVSLDPLPFAFEMPIYLVAIGGLAFGFAFGAASAWFAGHGARRALRLGKARIASLESEVSQRRAASETSRETAPNTPTAASTANSIQAPAVGQLPADAA